MVVRVVVLEMSQNSPHLLLDDFAILFLHFVNILGVFWTLFVYFVLSFSCKVVVVLLNNDDSLPVC